MLRWILIILFFLLLDLYAYQSIKTLTDNGFIKGLFFGLNMSATALCFYIYLIDREAFSTSKSNIIVGAFIILTLTKLVPISMLLLEDAVRVCVHFLSPRELDHFPSRRKFISQASLAIASLPATALLYGVFKGKYDFRIIRHTLHFDDLPQAFDGYQITHVSDFHCGSFDNRKKVEYGINLINQQASDLIAFTGDLVNLKSSEILPWKSTFSQLRAKDGVFSILGNHDYGDYAQWSNKRDKKDNFSQMLALQREMGFDLLRNEKRHIQRSGEKIAIVGVENWGKGFVKKANLNKALGRDATHEFSIVLSHDPTHWEEEISQHPKPLQLTLSGHTHGMQMGIEIPGYVKWSPIKYRYKRWAGIYKEHARYININRGFGFLAFPGRIGIWPEITVITLKRRNKND